MILIECLPHDFHYFEKAIEVLVEQNIACPTTLNFVKECLDTQTDAQYFVFKNVNGDYNVSEIDEIFDIENINYLGYDPIKENNKYKYNEYSGLEFYKEIIHKFNISLNKPEKSISKMAPTYQDVCIPLEIAKEMYLSDNPTIKNYILTIYTESELKDPPYAKYKTVEDIISKNDMMISAKTGPSFLTLLRDALNDGIKIDYIKDPIYIPIIKVVENRYADNYLEDQIREKFSINGKQYCLVTGTRNEYLPINGLFNIQKDTSVGAVSLHCGYLAFATPEIAMHAAKYFAKEIFEVVMWGYSEDIVVKWLMKD